MGSVWDARVAYFCAGRGFCGWRQRVSSLRQARRKASTWAWGSLPFEGRNGQVNGAAHAERKSAVQSKCSKTLDRIRENSSGGTKEAAILRSGFTEDFNPEGSIENEIIDDLVFNRLIKRRIDIAFTREFSKASIETSIKEMERDERSDTQYWLRIAGLSNEYRMMGNGPSAYGLPHAFLALKNYSAESTNVGSSPRTWRCFARLTATSPANAAIAMYARSRVGSRPNKTDGLGPKDEAALKKDILETLETEIQQQGLREEHAKRISEIENSSDIQEPPPLALATLLRYRAANTREFKDLLDILERTRRLRRNAA